MTIRSIFPEEVETALTQLSDGCVDVILDNIDKPPTSPKFAKMIIELQQRLKENPELADAMKEQMKDIFDVEQARALSEGFLKEVNDAMQLYWILCVSTDKASERMWE